MHDLDPLLQVDLLRWREDLRRIDVAAVPTSDADRVRDRSVRVFIHTVLDDEALAGLGIKVSSRIGGMVVGEVALRDAERAARAPGIDRLAPDQPIKPQLDGSVPQIGAKSVWEGSPGFRGRNVIVGVIDTGVDIFHDSFRLADRKKSRILSIWDQNSSSGAKPTGFNYGTEYLRERDIEPALTLDVNNPGSATFPHTDGEFEGNVRLETGGHGTHVLSIAAGDGSPVDTCDFAFTYIGVAPDAELIFVSHAGRGTYVLEALDYIFRVAAAKDRPVVVNISLGWNLGARDGSDLLDRGIDDLLAPGGVGVPRRAVVISAGNDGNKYRHARKPIAAGGTADFNFVVQSFRDYPNDVAQDRFDIWFDGAASVNLTIDGPEVGGTVSQAIPAAGGTFPISGNTVHVSAATIASNGQNHIRIEIDASTATPVSKGPWAFRFEETSNTPATIDIWIDREDSDVYPLFFEDESVRENTVTTPGTCQSVITVGSYDPDRFLGLGIGDFDLSDFSGWGLQLGDLAPGQRLKPDIAAPGESITAAASGTSRHRPPCCRCCNRLHVEMQGTSMATPHVAGVVALMFEKNQTLTCADIRAHIQATASLDSVPAADRPTVLPIDHGGGGIGDPGDPAFKPILQNNRWGSGRINAQAAVASLIPGPAIVVDDPGGGGGGNPGPITIDNADPGLERLSPARGILGLPERLAGHPALQLLAALASTHVDEARRLIDTNRRVAVVWRRGGGPDLLRHLLDAPADAKLPLPVAVGAFSSAGLLDRLMKVFARFGSEPLKADIVRWRDFILAAPGADLDTLDARLEEASR